jgi:hypothetical protein
LAKVNDTLGYNTADDAHQALLRSIAEQLKMPLMYIARQAEFYRGEETIDPLTFRDMQTNADMALRLVDSYILGLDLATKQLNLQLEPVSISSTLYDIAHDLTPLLRQRNTELQLVLAGKYGEVMAHKQGLMAALYNVGSVLSEIEAADSEKHTIRIVAHHSPCGIIAGMYVDQSVATPSLTRGKASRHEARQPFAEATAQNGAGIFVADAIFASMNTKLRFGRFRGTHGLAATLQPNRQLQLI